MKTIVVAHDSPAVRDRFVAALESAGHKAVAADSRAALLARVKADADPFDLIVLDLSLSPAEGVDLVHSIRAIESRRIPVLVFSGSVRSAREIRELAALGVAGYVNEHSAVQHILPSVAPHLFPDSFNRRSGPRVMLGVPVEYRFGTTIGTALALDVGAGGVAIRTTSPLEAGSKVTLRFRMPGSRRDVEAEGRVTWSDRRVGMGVQFEAIEPASQSMVDTFVEAHGLTRRNA